mmetsp:Transcript_50379/g.162666  ORF Transcript_50379/g.162666 Transcript_50379/m.162666 type:complete len:257 (+) Transcript_50379:218-988(+)
MRSFASLGLGPWGTGFDSPLLAHTEAVVAVVSHNLDGALRRREGVADRLDAVRRRLAEQAEAERVALHLAAPARRLCAGGEERLDDGGRGLARRGKVERGVALLVLLRSGGGPGREQDGHHLGRLAVAGRRMQQRVAALPLAYALRIPFEQGAHDVGAAAIRDCAVHREVPLPVGRARRRGVGREQRLDHGQRRAVAAGEVERGVARLGVNVGSERRVLLDGLDDALWLDGGASSELGEQGHVYISATRVSTYTKT